MPDTEKFREGNILESRSLKSGQQDLSDTGSGKHLRQMQNAQNAGTGGGLLRWLLGYERREDSVHIRVAEVGTSGVKILKARCCQARQQPGS